MFSKFYTYSIHHTNLFSQLYTYTMHPHVCLVLPVMVCHGVSHVLILCSLVVHLYTFHYTVIPPPLIPSYLYSTHNLHI